MPSFQTDTSLKPETRLYRYVSLEAFIAFLETHTTTLTNVNEWDDTWEAILSKIPNVDEEGRHDPPLYSFHQKIFGQSWSLVEESDAMWRIYSPNRNGLRIDSTVAKFTLIGDVQRSYIGKVDYFATVEELVAKAEPRQSPFHEALLKRIAFQHEQEVRFLTHADFLGHFKRGSTHVSLPLDPCAFIEGVTLDPRADEWYVDAIVRFSARAGLPNRPTKSALYDANPHLKLGLVRRWVPVDRHK